MHLKATTDRFRAIWDAQSETEAWKLIFLTTRSNSEGFLHITVKSVRFEAFRSKQIFVQVDRSAKAPEMLDIHSIYRYCAWCGRGGENTKSHKYGAPKLSSGGFLES